MTPPETPASSAPEGLQARGRVLWSALGLSIESAAGQLALEACRTADRLDELDSLIAGKGVLNLLQFRLNHDFEDETTGDRKVEVVVKIQGVLAEARGQQLALKAVLEKLGLDSTAKPAAGTAAANALDELKKRREAKGS